MKDGQPFKAPIVQLPCPASRSIYVPLDDTIRKALIVNDHKKPHSHPIPPMTKVTYEMKNKYIECVEAHGVFGSTVVKVENGACPYTYFLH